MNPQLHESDLSAAFEEFVCRCSQQFQELGFDVASASGAFELRLKNEPAVDTADSEAWNGRFWLNNPRFANSLWPCCNSHGVYLFFDEGGMARYVGKAENYIGNRLGAHMGPRGPNRDYPQKAFKNAAYIISLPFRKAPFLAPAFESFLLCAYTFPDNKRGHCPEVEAA